jgi:hypothetical protein
MPHHVKIDQDITTRWLSAWLGRIVAAGRTYTLCGVNAYSEISEGEPAKHGGLGKENS